MKTLKPLFPVCFLVAALAVSACNTMEGAGQDLKRAGDAISGAARDARN